MNWIQYVQMAGRAKENLHGGSLKYLFVYLKVRIFKCSYRVYIYMYYNIYIYIIYICIILYILYYIYIWIIIYYILYIILYYIILYIYITYYIYMHILRLNIVKQEYGVLWYNSLTHTKTTRLLFFTLWQYKWWLFSVFPQTKSLIYVDIYICIYLYIYLFIHIHICICIRYIYICYIHACKYVIHILYIYTHAWYLQKLSRRRSRRSGKWIPKTSTRVPWLPWLQGEETASDAS